MDNNFDIKERLFRAVFPQNIKPLFWKKDGTISSAAFKDPRGLSVERSYDRSRFEVISSMKKRFKGNIVSVSVKECLNVECFLCYCPSVNSEYHSEIHGSKNKKLLSSKQSRYLAQNAKTEYEKV